MERKPYEILFTNEVANLAARVDLCWDCNRSIVCPIRQFVQDIKSQQGKDHLPIDDLIEKNGLVYQAKDQITVLSGPEQGPHIILTCPGKSGTIELFKLQKGNTTEE